MYYRFFNSPLIAILLLFSISQVVAQAKSDRERAFLTGQVKTVTSASLDYFGSEVRHSTGEKKAGDTVTYDKAGNEIERIMISDYGFPIGKNVSSYSSDGRLSESTFFDEKGVLQDQTLFQYEGTRLAQILRYDAKKVLREKTVRAFDDKGRVKEETYFDPKIARAKTIFTYDDKGKIGEMSFFLTDGSKAIARVGPCLGAHRVVHTHDDIGRILTQTVFETDGKEKKRFDYSYDAKGLYSESTARSPFSTVRYTFSYEYDAAGNWIKQTRITHSSNGMAKIFDSIAARSNETVTAEQKQKLADMDKRTTVTIREITYY